MLCFLSEAWLTHSHSVAQKTASAEEPPLLPLTSHGGETQEEIPEIQTSLLAEVLPAQQSSKCCR